MHASSYPFYPTGVVTIYAGTGWASLCWPLLSPFSSTFRLMIILILMFGRQRLIVQPFRNQTFYPSREQQAAEKVPGDKRFLQAPKTFCFLLLLFAKALQVSILCFSSLTRLFVSFELITKSIVQYLIRHHRYIVHQDLNLGRVSARES